MLAFYSNSRNLPTYVYGSWDKPFISSLKMNLSTFAFLSAQSRTSVKHKKVGGINEQMHCVGRRRLKQ